MTIGLVLQESMSGWLKLDADGREQPFDFTIRAFTPHFFRLSTPRAFRGLATLDGAEYSCEGELTIYTGGPHYWLDFSHPTLGRVHVEGKKTYSLNGLIRSLTTCPMEVFKGGTRIGAAEVAYRDSMLAFPFTALKLAKEENAFGQYGEI